ncbi:MAG: hypothetical protein AAF502_12230 [Bacteroidota bacterium]
MQPYQVPQTAYFQDKSAFDQAVGDDFIRHANIGTQRGKYFLVGLSLGQSPSGAYQYILDNFSKIKRPLQILFAYVNTPLKRQRDLIDIVDAQEFTRQLIAQKLIDKKQICHREFDRENLEAYNRNFIEAFGKILSTHKKDGLDYVFLASDPLGQVAGITRHSKAFASENIAEIVQIKGSEEFTLTPHFLKRSKRIAFLATKSDKRRALAMLFIRDGDTGSSPAFLRDIEDLEKKMTVFIDDDALTWPQIELVRKATHGDSVIRIDVPNPYRENAKKKLPVILLTHGFLGLNSYDGLLTVLPSSKVIAAAMHYGSVPDALPPAKYSEHIVNNINFVIDYFGSNGHDVYLFDHSIANIYAMMLNRDLDKLPAVRKYVKGRIGANPFFGKEAKHATLGFIDNVLIPAVKSSKDSVGNAFFQSARRVLPLDTKNGVRKRGIKLTQWLISKETPFRNRIWKEAKQGILSLMSNLDLVPPLNKIPIERALARLPVKLFAIQIHSALLESKSFDWQKGLDNFDKHNIPVLVLKSDRDPIAKFMTKVYQGDNIKVMDMTDEKNEELFKEHLYHMVNPWKTAEIIEQFIKGTI